MDERDRRNKERTKDKMSKPRGEVPADYVCRLCNQPGHWIQDCKFAVKSRGAGDVISSNNNNNNNNNNNKRDHTGARKVPDDYVCNRCHKKGHFIADW